MARTAAILGVRFVVIAALYTIVVAVWIDNARGWERLGLFGAGVALGFAAMPSWGAAVAIGHFCLANRWLRLIAHPILTALLFIVASYVLIIGFDHGTLESMWRDVRPFAGLVAAAAAGDALAGLLLEWWKPLPAGSPA